MSDTTHEEQNLGSEGNFMLRFFRRVGEYGNFTQTIINTLVLLGMFSSAVMYINNESTKTIQKTIAPQLAEMEKNINNRLTSMENNTNAKLDSFDVKLEPLVRANEQFMILNILKQASKIEKTPDDIKDIDISKALNDWESINNKTVTLKIAYDTILEWYKDQKN